MSTNAKWARANIPEAAELSDYELDSLSREAWKRYRIAYLAAFGIAFFLYTGFIEDRLVQALFDAPSFRHYLVTGMILGGVLGGLLGMIFQTLVRRRIRGSNASE